MIGYETISSLLASGLGSEPGLIRRVVLVVVVVGGDVFFFAGGLD
jgi:hypothetical protein